MRILIVDDSADVRRMLSSIMASLDFQVAQASTAASALKYLKTHAPDAIMTDFNMPGMDGLAFIERARQTPNGRDVPIFVLSSESCPDKLEKAARWGVKAWMTKPMNVQALTCALMKEVA